MSTAGPQATLVPLTPEVIGKYKHRVPNGATIPYGVEFLYIAGFDLGAVIRVDRHAGYTPTFDRFGRWTVEPIEAPDGGPLPTPPAGPPAIERRRLMQWLLEWMQRQTDAADLVEVPVEAPPVNGYAEVGCLVATPGDPLSKRAIQSALDCMTREATRMRRRIVTMPRYVGLAPASHQTRQYPVYEFRAGTLPL